MTDGVGFYLHVNKYGTIFHVDGCGTGLTYLPTQKIKMLGNTVADVFATDAGGTAIQAAVDLAFNSDINGHPGSFTFSYQAVPLTNFKDQKYHFFGRATYMNSDMALVVIELGDREKRTFLESAGIK